MLAIMPVKTTLASTKSFYSVVATEPMTTKASSAATTMIHKLLAQGLPKRPLATKIKQDKSQFFEQSQQRPATVKDEYQQNNLRTVTLKPKQV